jgi:hypothetical protein
MTNDSGSRVQEKRDSACEIAEHLRAYAAADAGPVHSDKLQKLARELDRCAAGSCNLHRLGCV